MADSACGQERQYASNPAKAACYDDAWAWFVEQCAACGGNTTCESEIRALYWLMLFNCDNPQAPMTENATRALDRCRNDRGGGCG